MAGIAFLLAWYFDISRVELGLLVLTITIVIAAEIINTALEVFIDLLSPEYHPLAGLVKDIAAGAVLFTALAALFVGCLLFSHKLFTY